MDLRRVFGMPVLTLLLGGYSLVANTSQTTPRAGGQALIKRPGTFNSPNGKCEAALKTSESGGFLILTTGKNVRISVNDFTCIILPSDKTLVYTTIPIYCKPAIYIFGLRPGHM